MRPPVWPSATIVWGVARPDPGPLRDERNLRPAMIGVVLISPYQQRCEGLQAAAALHGWSRARSRSLIHRKRRAEAGRSLKVESEGMPQYGKWLRGQDAKRPAYGPGRPEGWGISCGRARGGHKILWSGSGQPSRNRDGSGWFGTVAGMVGRWGRGWRIDGMAQYRTRLRATESKGRRVEGSQAWRSTGRGCAGNRGVGGRE